MSQSSNVNTGDNAIDPERVYCTSAVIKKVGRAVAVSLEDATLPGNAKNKHMTILYRKGKKWSDEEIHQICMAEMKWIVENFGSDKAPVTFTIQEWGRKSMMIKGDLEELCLHLRRQFASMSEDAQRVPHVELFVGKAAKERSVRMNGDNVKVKLCYICGGTDHYKKRCPMKDPKPHKEKKHGLKGRMQKMKGKYSKHSKHSPKVHDPEKARDKARVKLTKIMSRIQSQKEKKMQEIALLDAKQGQIAALLSNVDNLDGQTVNEEVKNIALSFKRHRKDFKKSCKRMKRRRSKQSKRESKEMKFLMKQIRREEKDARKQEKKAKKEEKKRMKSEMKQKLAAARISTLPTTVPTGNGNDHSPLSIHVDGYNLIGCDAECRKGMRGGRRGMKKSRQRLARLLQENFMNQSQIQNVRVTLWFDGKGQSEKYGDIEIAFSSSEQIVDDKLVEMFSAIKGNFVVITSDRKLTVRLHDCGVMVMKSGVFYKKYLKVKQTEKMDVDENENDKDNDEDTLVNDEKEQDDDTMDDSTADDFVHVITDKVICGLNDGEEVSPDGDSGDNGDETDDVPDEVEGSVHRYITPGADEGEDSDYLEIFGDEDDETSD